MVLVIAWCALERFVNNFLVPALLVLPTPPTALAFAYLTTLDVVTASRLVELCREEGFAVDLANGIPCAIGCRGNSANECFTSRPGAIGRVVDFGLGTGVADRRLNSFQACSSSSILTPSNAINRNPVSA